MKNQHLRGFSLIEMVVAMAVLGILMAAVMPNIGEWLSNSKVRTAAESIQAGLQIARGDAVKSNRTVTLWLVSLADDKVMDNSCQLASTSGSWVVSVASPVGACATAPSTLNPPMLVSAHPMGDGGEGVTVAALQSDGVQAATSVSFNGFGQVVGTGGISKIDVSATGATRALRIQVSPSGSTFVCDPHVTDNHDPRYCP